MLEALEDGKFDPSRGTQLSTFFEQVVNGDILDHLKKENLYSRRHALCGFQDDHDDTPMDGEPVKKAAAVQQAAEKTMALGWVGEENEIHQLNEIRQQLDHRVGDVNLLLVMTKLEDDDKTNEELGSELGISGNAYQKRYSRALEKLRSALTNTDTRRKMKQP